MTAQKRKHAARLKRHSRSRVRIIGTTQRPRMNIFRSLDNIYVQVIDDPVGRTLVSASTLDKEVVSQLEGKTKVDAAKLVGKIAGERA
jgi:large subunit ribosomal protein L18